MNPIRNTIVLALRLAARRRGVTAGELAELAGCSISTAQRHLAALAADGVLTCTVPVRKGAAYGSWRNLYKLAKGGGPEGS
jgi:predicted ArsR family transcriptional regulator